MTKKLFRSKQNSVIAGLCGGLGEYFNVDPIIVRLIAVALFLAGAIGFLLYIIGWIAVPKKN
ncbi:MAG: PspC domain-containing protein [Pseudomonadota bacterium]